MRQHSTLTPKDFDHYSPQFMFFNLRKTFSSLTFQWENILATASATLQSPVRHTYGINFKILLILEISHSQDFQKTLVEISEILGGPAILQFENPR